MPLSSGTRLGPYEILAAIGAGGMGEVYKARDTRLDRSVAIKILPAHVGADPERRTRFEREAKTIAGLTHPHICTLYDVGEHPSTGSGQATLYLVMEHLTGETLAQRLTKGPLPLEQALSVAAEIAEALAAAHRHGVIHRDLKPGNVMLTKTGAKLLDFGLAKLKPPAAALGASATASVPTQEPATAAGMLLGTVPYMAPEQLEGKEADARSDLFSFGAVLYEMLTGKRAFEGESHASIVAAILDRDPPPPSSTTPLTPPVLDRLVRQCLAKSPDERPDTAHDVATELRWVKETSGLAVATSARQPHRATMRAPLMAVAALLLIGVGAIGRGMWLAGAPPPVAHVSLDVQPADEVNAGGYQSEPAPAGSHTAFAWTPDGRSLVFVGRRGGTQQLYVRALANDEARPVSGTEGALVFAVSPDGQWVAFWAAGMLKKVPLAGGPVAPLVSPLSPPHGLAWDSHGILYFGDEEDGCIRKVQPDGKVVQVAKVGETEQGLVMPWMLPGDQVLLYTVKKHHFTSGDSEVVAQTLSTGKRIRLLQDAADARYVPTGHLVFLRQGMLFAVRFDAAAVKIEGDAVLVLPDVAQVLTALGTGDATLAGQFAVASTGALAWLRAPAEPVQESATLVTVDRQGRVSPTTAPVKAYGFRVRLDPPAHQIAASARTVREISLWTHDLVRGTSTPVLREGEVSSPAVWTRDGQRLVFSWVKDGRQSLASQRVDGTTPPEVLVAGSRGAQFLPSSWTPDGRQLAVVNIDAGSLAVVTLERGRATVTPFPQAPTNAGYPEFSPDGKWLAYVSDYSGRWEVYVQPYPGPGPRTQVSTAGGHSPAWRGDGRGLFFIKGEADKGRMTEVEFQPTSPPRVGVPRQLFEYRTTDLRFSAVYVRAYDVTPDGHRFFVLQNRPRAPRPPVTHVNIVLNWLEELKAKVSTER